jgi:methylmalonyl-CoA/ethylmalonyl-CoA epimerase
MNLSDATIAQLLIPVDEFERGVAFYRDVLGLPFLFAAPPQMAFFACGPARILVGVLPAGQKAQRGSAIYFGVKDISGVFSSLRDNGVKFTASPHIVHRTPKSELWLAEFTDPDGNPLALMTEVAVGDSRA